MTSELDAFYQRKIFCLLWIDKKTSEPFILMSDGKYLFPPRPEMRNAIRDEDFES